MEPLYPTEHNPESLKQVTADLLARPDEWWVKQMGLPIERISQHMKEIYVKRLTSEDSVGKLWANDTYAVHVRDCGDGPLGRLVHLSIKRHDKGAVIDWRDKQAIKNQLCGEDAEGMELYPAEKRVVDTANQFHLWVLLDCPIPIGFPEGSKDYSTDRADNSVQRGADEPIDAAQSAASLPSE